jgi:AhpD family alkylhydroperoxidase
MEPVMTPRPNPYTDAMKLVQPLIDLAGTVSRSGLQPRLMELVKIRASQINGCAMCLHMHTLEARRAGESEQRL